MIISPTTGKTDAVKIFQNLDSQFTSHVKPIAEIGGTRRSSFLIEFADHISEGDNPIVTLIAIFNNRSNDALLGCLS